MITFFNWQEAKQHAVTETYCHPTIAGNIKLSLQGEMFCHMQWVQAPATKLPHLTEKYQQAINDCWLSNTAIPFLLLQQGTAFQQKVWATLREIPIGETRSYGELAKSLNTSPRALANACRQNPFPLIIPCHRVVSKSGIGGYAGAVSGTLIDIKLALLNYEKSISHEL